MTAGLLAAKLALGPLLLPQASWLRRTALRLPEAPGPREGVAGEGPEKLRLLVVGDSSAAGVGLPAQQSALALPLAETLARNLRGSVPWQLAAKSGVNAAEATRWLETVPLNGADAAVIVLGVNDVSSQNTAAGFLGHMEALWDSVRARTGARWAVVSGLPPMHLLTAVPQPLRWYLGRYAAWLDSGLRGWAAERGFGYCDLRWAMEPSLLSHDGFHPGPRLYPLWVRRIAEIFIQGEPQWKPA